MKIETAMAADGLSSTLVLPDQGVSLPLARIGGVWRRRIHYAIPPAGVADPGDRNVAENDSRHA